MPPSAIQVIRHAEKPPGGGAPHGVTVEGAKHEHSLTVRGWQRAGALARLFAPAHAAAPAGLARPDALVCADYGRATTSHRAYETLLPLADRLGLAIEHPLRLEHSAALYERALRPADGAVLVCWEHHVIPELVAAIPLAPGSPAPPASWGDRYDVVWAFTAAPGAPDAPGGDAYRFAVVPQLLLDGDGPA